MRISSDSKDPDYFLCLFEGPVRVLLDGEEVRMTVEADDVAGYVHHHVRNENGSITRNHDGTGFLNVRSEGRIEIVGKVRPERLVNAN